MVGLVRDLCGLRITLVFFCFYLFLLHYAQFFFSVVHKFRKMKFNFYKKI